MARKRTKRAKRAKRRYHGSALWKWNQKRKRKHKGGKRKRKHTASKRKRRAGKRKHKRSSKRRSKRRSRRSHGGGKKRRRGRRHAHSGFAVSSSKVYQSLIDKGYSPQRAHKVASRLERMRKGRISRYFSKETASKESAGRLANMFAGFAAAGRAHKAIG